MARAFRASVVRDRHDGRGPQNRLEFAVFHVPVQPRALKTSMLSLAFRSAAFRVAFHVAWTCRHREKIFGNTSNSPNHPQH
jgi:hypothetical protein